jgi:uncharacterized membrane protein YedE/YeeE
MLVAAGIAGVIQENVANFQVFDEDPKSGLSMFGFGVAGLLVGAGTKLANGCTSGHGVCGIPRLSTRSLAAVTTFLATGILTSTLAHHFPSQFLSQRSAPSPPNFKLSSELVLGLAAAGSLAVLLFGFVKRSRDGIVVDAVGWGVGVVFGAGLVLAGMNRRSIIGKFLTISEGWSPALLFVMAGAILINLFTFTYIRLRLKSPLAVT